MRHQFITSKNTIVINGLYNRHDWYRVECHKNFRGICKFNIWYIAKY
jgi:hypothetical protein